MTKTRIFVANLPINICEEELLAMFLDYGASEAQIRPGSGYGYLSVNKRFAQKAILEMDGQKSNGHMIHVSAVRFLPSESQ